MENDFKMFHHIIQIGGTEIIKKPKTIALNSFGPLSTVVWLKYSSALFGNVAE